MRRGLVVLASSCVALLVAGGPATAARHNGNGNTNASGSKHGDKITAEVGYTYSLPRGPGSGPIASVDSNWTPPPCWYAPVYTATEFKESRRSLWYAAVHDPDARGQIQSDIAKENQGYAKDDYNIDKEKEGMWWDVQFSDDATLEQMQKCNKPPFWVKNGETPDVPQAVSPEILAGLAYKQMRVPGTKVSLAPADITKVNLPTWAWLDKAEFKPVSVTASLDVPGLHIEATTTATPKGLTLDPGTQDATLFPANGQCTLDGDSIGTPWKKGVSGAPPCGVTYLRSSGDGTFDLRATATWEVAWKGTGGAGGTMPDGQYGSHQPVKVQEIQAVNR
ncbi:hypothetical protein [Streptomyces sp. NPDC001020]